MNLEKIKNTTDISPEKQADALTMQLASLLHEEWRNSRYDPDNNTYEPRIKKTDDQEWIAKKGTNEVDIANTSFNNLPNDWQNENLISAGVALEKLEDVLYLIHDKWLDRHFDHASDEQKVQYSRLPVQEKEKDISVILKAIEIIKKNNS